MEEKEDEERKKKDATRVNSEVADNRYRPDPKGDTSYLTNASERSAHVMRNPDDESENMSKAESEFFCCFRSAGR